jgi:signal peptidase II
LRSALTAAIVILADQVTKLAVVASFQRGEGIDVLGRFLKLGHARNSGAVFGIMRGSGNYFTIFSILAALIITVVIYLARRSGVWVRIALGLVLGGAVGNLIDRLRLGAVVDFIDIGVSDTIRWPSFNVADLAITVGVIALIVGTMKSDRKLEGDSQVS